MTPARWLAALAALTLLRLAVAAAMPLAPDEAYYWVWSRALAPGYLDHPPMVALWIRAGTWLVGDGPLGVRLLAPLAAAAGAIMLADAGERLFPGRRAGVVGAALLNATLLVNVGAVTMTPDVPLIFFWTATLWALARLGGGGWLLVAGLFGGLALDSKYTGGLLGVGMALWLLVAPAARRWLRTPYPYAAGLIAAAVFAPVLLWNAAHGWVSLVKQGGRVGAWQPARAAQFLGELVGGQIGLATPLVFVLLVAGVVVATRHALRRREPGWTLLAASTVPPALVFLQHALGDRVQGNWPAILYPGAALAAGALQAPAWRRLRRPALVLGAAIVGVVYIQAVFAPLRLSPRIDPTALRLAGWPALAGEIERERRAHGLAFVAADDYGVAAKLGRLLPPGVVVIGAEPRWRLFDLPQLGSGGEPGLLVRSARRRKGPDRQVWDDITELGRAARERDGQVIEQFRLFEVSPRPAVEVGARLPRPAEVSAD